MGTSGGGVADVLPKPTGSDVYMEQTILTVARTPNDNTEAVSLNNVFD